MHSVYHYNREVTKLFQWVLLQHLLDDFPGAANQTRCFAHIINLVVKSILRQFDVPKTKAKEALDEASKVLLHIAEDIET